MLDFDISFVRKNKIELLDCQVELILRSLEFYIYSYKFLDPRFGMSASKEENLRVSLVCDTYEQIMNEFGVSRTQNPIGSRIFDDVQNFLKKVS